MDVGKDKDYNRDNRACAVNAISSLNRCWLVALLKYRIYSICYICHVFSRLYMVSLSLGLRSMLVECASGPTFSSLRD